MSGYGITPEEMAKAAVDVDNVNEQSQNSLKSLGSALQPLHDNWSGNAARAFATLMQRYNDDANKLHTALEAISQQLKESNAAYVRQEEESSSSLSNITSVLGG
ncbi:MULTISPECIES: WXG100 family type VII secretion target [Actinokineospora]|uniref:ESAT-6-like protein n=1 Tax=Actinokineospora diospyrosa TaxID=103728 RepID=A0ABT1IJY5_9PSEU|nr:MULTISPECIES: WXG100 family type VII secretion target [Actinokineospora]MBM7770291.1 WXG100 family type VII secretion target [Actinokineospora baliensis]MCP2272521.1 WXG100 family type VII secretion target [Actinokineospora diospyrosa]